MSNAASSSGQKVDYTLEDKRTAFLQSLNTVKVDVQSLFEDEDKSPLGNFREDRHLSSSRFKPCEVKINGNKSIAQVLSITGEAEEADDFLTMVKMGVERFYDQMTSQETWEEKGLVNGYKSFISGHAADTYKLVLNEMSITEDANGKYPAGTYLNVCSEWLAKLHNKPVMRDNYLAFLRAGRLKKSNKVSSRALLIFLKTCIRIIIWQKGEDSWPDAVFFVKCYYKAMKCDHCNSFRVQHSTTKEITLGQIADFMTLQEQSDALRSGDRRRA